MSLKSATGHQNRILGAQTSNASQQRDNRLSQHYKWWTASEKPDAEARSLNNQPLTSHVDPDVDISFVWKKDYYYMSQECEYNLHVLLPNDFVAGGGRAEK